jgi:hypothetical protein
MLDMLEARPTVAGPPLDVESLRRLARALDLDEDGDAPLAPIVLSEGEQRCLELLRDQAVIRDKLPMRVRQTCTACGDERIINPARQAKAAETARSAVSGQALLSSAQLLSEGHPVLATLNLLGGLGSGGGEEDKPPVCPRCEGDDYDHTPVTFCPGCRAIRDESVLLRCPECEFEFLPRRGEEPLWIPTSQALAQLSRTRHRAAVRRRAKDFENGMWPNQLQALVDALDTDDEPVVMCRCGRPGEVGRYLALLVTTEHLVWAWESPLSGTKSGKLPWRDVRALHELGTPANAQHRGIRVESAEGEAVAVVNFRGTGVGFADPPAGSTVEDLLTLMASLHRRHGGTGEIVRAAVPPVPSPISPGPISPSPASPGPISPSPVSPVTVSPVPAAHPPAPLPEMPAPVTLEEPAPPAPLPTPAPMPPPMTRPAVGVAQVPTHQPTPPTPPPPQPAPTQPAPAQPAPAQPASPGGGAANPPPPAGWYADPWRTARLRWWSGTQWTGHTSA